MTRYAKKVDGNHAEIRDKLRSIPGVKVLDTSFMSRLGCDLIVFYQDKPAIFMEIKSGPKEPMTDSEKHLRKLAGYQYVRVETIEGAMMALGLDGQTPPF